MDIYNIILLGAGIIVLMAGILPNILKKRRVAMPIFYLVLSGVLFGLILDMDISNDTGTVYWGMRITEIAVIVSLTGVGLKINRPFDPSTWKLSSKLLIIAMPLTILMMAIMGWWFLSLVPATAVLLGAVIAPTDPVLADEFQTTPPLKEDSCSVRVALTTESGLNDGLAFPFTNMAIAIAFAGIAPSGWFLEWFLWDFIYKIAIGAVAGLVIGWILGKVIFSIPPQATHKSKMSIGLAVIGLTLIPYGVAEILESYGFIAVFIAACTFKQQESGHEYLSMLHDFSEELEQIFILIVFMLIGVYLASGFTSHFHWYMIPVALVAIFVMRPLSGLLSLAGASLSLQKKLTISFFGIRGVGSIYYMMYAMHHASFKGAEDVLALVTVIIILSVLIHGIISKPVMEYLDEEDR